MVANIDTRDTSVVGKSLPPQKHPLVGQYVAPELLHQARLSGAWFSGDENETSMAEGCLVKLVAQALEFEVALN